MPDTPLRRQVFLAEEHGNSGSGTILIRDDAYAGAPEEDDDGLPNETDQMDSPIVGTDDIIENTLGSGTSTNSHDSRCLRFGPHRQIWKTLTQKISAQDRRRYLNGRVSKEVRERSNRILRLLLLAAAPGPFRTFLREEKGVILNRKCISINAEYKSQASTILDAERTVRAAFKLFQPVLPSEIWHCCKGACFASVMINNRSNLTVVMSLKTIHETAKRLHSEIEGLNRLVESRRKGVGRSNMAFSAPSRQVRELETGTFSTDRQRKVSELSAFVREEMPYLRGQRNAPDGSSRPIMKLCTEAIRLLFCVSRMYLYYRKKVKLHKEGEDQHVFTSLVDTTSLRMRQYRRVGSRAGFPSLADMASFNCGCHEPCFGSRPLWRIQRLYDDFRKVSMSLKPRVKEHQFLLNIMFCPLTNSIVKQCNRSVGNLLTVSEGLVGSVRDSLDRLCIDESLEDYALQENWEKHGYTYHNHPILRYGPEVREMVENHLNMVLRADPAGGSETNVCRVYDLEVNTHEKLRKLLSSLVSAESEEAPKMSSSTLQREINRCLESRNLRISFQLTDHNACPNCKAMRYAAMEHHQNYKQLRWKLDKLQANVRSNAGDDAFQHEKEAVELQMNSKKKHEEQVTAELQSHCTRDMLIRKALKNMSDHFRGVENNYIMRGIFETEEPAWASIPSHAHITHQDDMTKVDLPYFVQSASADITRWRFDSNARVNDDAIVFSHEQGCGSKNASCIAEDILLDHIIRCRGEGIKLVVSDNAAVGKNWLCTVALAQYIVDHGLADIVLMVLLENNHGKWLADMLFGQLQTKRRRTSLMGVDDLLKEFESIKRKRGKVRGFGLNALSSIDFQTVLNSLGYAVKPPKNFGFVKRNIHFAGACRPGAKESLKGKLKVLLGPALPDNPGMVRLSTNPPSEKSQKELPYSERYTDVPACNDSREMEVEKAIRTQEQNAPAAATAAQSNMNMRRPGIQTTLQPEADFPIKIQLTRFQDRLSEALYLTQEASELSNLLIQLVRAGFLTELRPI